MIEKQLRKMPTCMIMIVDQFAFLLGILWVQPIKIIFSRDKKIKKILIPPPMRALKLFYIFQYHIISTKSTNSIENVTINNQI